MFLKMLRAKIHRATITEADIDYVGSVTLDPDLYDAVGILPGEQVLVADLNNGQRFETYVMEGQRGSGTVCINGAAARLVHVGDRIIIMSFAYATPEEAGKLKPTVVLVNDKNQLVKKL
jgi:aspartate 1-decarboxylase